MNLEAQLWIADFCIAGALDGFLFFWGLRCGFFYWFVSGVYCVLGSGFGVFLLIRPADPPRSVPGLVWVFRPLYYGTRHAFRVFRLGSGWFLRFFVVSTPSAQCLDWSVLSGRSIVAQDTFSEFLGRFWGGSCVSCPAYTPPFST